MYASHKVHRAPGFTFKVGRSTRRKFQSPKSSNVYEPVVLADHSKLSAISDTCPVPILSLNNACNINNTPVSIYSDQSPRRKLCRRRSSIKNLSKAAIVSQTKSKLTQHKGSATRTKLVKSSPSKTGVTESGPLKVGTSKKELQLPRTPIISAKDKENFAGTPGANCNVPQGVNMKGQQGASLKRKKKGSAVKKGLLRGVARDFWSSISGFRPKSMKSTPLTSQVPGNVETTVLTSKRAQSSVNMRINDRMHGTDHSQPTDTCDSRTDKPKVTDKPIHKQSTPHLKPVAENARALTSQKVASVNDLKVKFEKTQKTDCANLDRRKTHTCQVGKLGKWDTGVNKDGRKVLNESVIEGCENGLGVSQVQELNENRDKMEGGKHGISVLERMKLFQQTSGEISQTETQKSGKLSPKKNGEDLNSKKCEDRSSPEQIGVAPKPAVRPKPKCGKLLTVPFGNAVKKGPAVKPKPAKSVLQNLDQSKERNEVKTGANTGFSRKEIIEENDVFVGSKKDSLSRVEYDFRGSCLCISESDDMGNEASVVGNDGGVVGNGVDVYGKGQNKDNTRLDIGNGENVDGNELNVDGNECSAVGNEPNTDSKSEDNIQNKFTDNECVVRPKKDRKTVEEQVDSGRESAEYEDGIDVETKTKGNSDCGASENSIESSHSANSQQSVENPKSRKQRGTKHREEVLDIEYEDVENVQPNNEDYTEDDYQDVQLPYNNKDIPYEVVEPVSETDEPQAGAPVPRFIISDNSPTPALPKRNFSKLDTPPKSPLNRRKGTKGTKTRLHNDELSKLVPVAGSKGQVGEYLLTGSRTAHDLETDQSDPPPLPPRFQSPRGTPIGSPHSSPVLPPRRQQGGIPGKPLQSSSSLANISAIKVLPALPKANSCTSLLRDPKPQEQEPVTTNGPPVAPRGELQHPGQGSDVTLKNVIPPPNGGAIKGQGYLPMEGNPQSAGKWQYSMMSRILRLPNDSKPIRTLDFILRDDYVPPEEGGQSEPEEEKTQPAYLDLIGDENKNFNDDDCIYADPSIYAQAAASFADQPLYQVYHQEAVIRDVMETQHGEEDEEDMDNLYSDVQVLQSHMTDILARRPSSSSQSGTGDNDDDDRAGGENYVRFLSGAVTGAMTGAVTGASRKLWSEMEEVRRSEQAQEMTEQDRKIQEALFEIVTSEASYLKSLHLLMAVFVTAPEFSPSQLQHSVITSRDHLVLFSNIAKVHDVSKRFLSDLEKQWRNSCVLDPVEVCRVITQYAAQDFEVYCKYCSNKLYQDRKLQELKIPLVSQSRSLVKKGSLTRVLGTNILDKLRKKDSLYLFLFNDLLLITKKKSASSYHVLDYCPRISVHAELVPESDVLRRFPNAGSTKNVLVLVLLEKNLQYVFSCESESDRLRWVESMTPSQQESGEEKIYEAWDCPQVQAVEKYVPQEPDELALEESDVVNVTRKMADGWYEGERIRDGQAGWFPSCHTVAIDNAHIRSRNLRQRYRLLQQVLNTYQGK